MPGDPWPWEYKPDDTWKIRALQCLNVYLQREKERERKYS